MPLPPIENLAEFAHEAFCAGVAEFLPPNYPKFQDASPLLREAWMDAVRAVLAPIGNA